MTSTVTLGGNPVQVSGKFPQKGDTAPALSLVGNDLADVTLKQFAGKRKILNIFPSIDTPTCATSVRTFNKRASEQPDTVVLCISADLPFAQKRFCGVAARAVVVLDAQDRVIHSELVPEIKNEPNYDAALKALA